MQLALSLKSNLVFSSKKCDILVTLFLLMNVITLKVLNITICDESLTVHLGHC